MIDLLGATAKTSKTPSRFREQNTDRKVRKINFFKSPLYS
jgi:hypothetical protein